MRNASIGTEAEQIGLVGEMTCPDGCTENLRPAEMQRAATIETIGEVVDVTEEFRCPKCGQSREIAHESRVIL